MLILVLHHWIEANLRVLAYYGHWFCCPSLEKLSRLSIDIVAHGNQPALSRCQSEYVGICWAWISLLLLKTITDEHRFNLSNKLFFSCNSISFNITSLSSLVDPLKIHFLIQPWVGILLRTTHFRASSSSSRDHCEKTLSALVFLYIEEPFRFKLQALLRLVLSIGCSPKK